MECFPAVPQKAPWTIIGAPSYCQSVIMSSQYTHERPWSVSLTAMDEQYVIVCDMPSKKILHSKNLSQHDMNSWYWPNFVRNALVCSSQQVWRTAGLAAKCSLLNVAAAQLRGCLQWLASPRHSSPHNNCLYTGKVTMRPWAESKWQSWTIFSDFFFFFNHFSPLCLAIMVYPCASNCE